MATPPTTHTNVAATHQTRLPAASDPRIAAACPLQADTNMLLQAADTAGPGRGWPDTEGGAHTGQPDSRSLADHEPLVDPTVTTHRIVSHPVYANAQLPEASDLPLQIRQGTAELLQAAASQLPEPFGFALLDTWRPLALQASLVADPQLIADGYVSAPSPDPALSPPHTTGGTIDTTLTYNGVPLALGTQFDHFGPAAHLRHPQPDHITTLRQLLADVLCTVGFVAYTEEWWHFEHGTRRWAAVRNTTPLYAPTTPDHSSVRH